MPVLARNVVATTQPLAAHAGLSMLARGGSAVDAAVATAITLTVVEPTSNGIGSDAFAIVWDGKEMAGLNASGRAPKSLDPERFTGTMPTEGWDAVTVPGAVSAWAALHGRWGKLPFETLFEPAIRYASDGFLVPPAIARLWDRQVDRLRHQPGFAEAFLPHGRAPLPGELFCCPDQAGTLQRIAATNGEAFYRGKLAEAILRAAKPGGSPLSAEDLAAHRCDWVEPIDIEFRGHRVHELPPNGQGIAALVALGILERCDLSQLDPDSPQMLHVQIEAMKLGMADVREHVGDPAYMQVTPAELLDPARLHLSAKAIRRDRVAVAAPPPQRAGGTVYLATADSAGMMVSLIQSNYMGFGSGVVVPGTGIALNNRGASFVTTKNHPNRVGPGKRALNTIIPGFISKDGAPVAAFGVMGGTMQPQGHVQVVSRMLASGQNPQAAIDAPRWRVEEGDVRVEATLSAEARRGLSARGHVLVEGDPLDFGASQIVRRIERGYVAGSESRRDGCAVGF
jgi:gamma-glutamyltranspeptidase/glutathione hydrolase